MNTTSNFFVCHAGHGRYSSVCNDTQFCQEGYALINGTSVIQFAQKITRHRGVAKYCTTINQICNIISTLNSTLIQVGKNCHFNIKEEIDTYYYQFKGLRAQACEILKKNSLTHCSSSSPEIALLIISSLLVCSSCMLCSCFYRYLNKDEDNGEKIYLKSPLFTIDEEEEQGYYGATNHAQHN